MTSSAPALLAGRALIANPSLSSPKLPFGNGGTNGGAATYFGTQPNISGPTSPWSLLEWSKNEYLDPTAMQTHAASTLDPLYGTAAYSWATPDGESALKIYGNGTTTPWVYDLEGSGGLLTNGGGTNVFLSDSTIAPNTNFGEQITYRLQANLDTANVAYYTAAARTDGAVLAQVFSGFTLSFNQPGSAGYNAALPTFNAFLQIGISDSAGPASATDYRSASQAPGVNGMTLIYGHLLPGDPSLPFAKSTGAPTTLTYNLNAYLDDMLTQPWPVTDASGNTTWVWLPQSTHNLSLWNLTSMYVGVETQNADGRPGSTSTAPQGVAAVGVQVSNIQLAQTSAPATYTNDPVRMPAVDPASIESYTTYQANSYNPNTDPLIDVAYIREMNPGIPATDNVAQDYASFGWKEGWNPDPYFNTNYVLAESPAVAASGLNPLQYFEQTGWQQGLNPSDLFNTQQYLQEYADVAAAHMDPLLHYIEYGQSEGRQVFAADPLIDPSYIRSQHPTIAATDDPVADFLNYGWKQGWNPDQYFDTNYYLQQYPSVAAAGVDPLQDYENGGWELGRNPSAAFSTNGYLAANPDVKAAGMDPLLHYILSGAAEGRTIVPVSP